MLKWIERKELEKNFLKNGFAVIDLEKTALLNQIRSEFVGYLRSQIKGGEKLGDEAYLNQFHQFSDPEKINTIRVGAHKVVGASESYRKLIYQLIEKELNCLIGNELAMQRQANFVFHFPKDPANILYLHTDCWSGCSPYEIILWLPLVDVYKTKSMFIMDREKNARHLQAMEADRQLADATVMRGRVDKDIQHLDMKFGQALLFSPTLIHGADENLTDETRFIINIRFKNLFSPYGSKSLGETFIPVHFSAATELALGYEKTFGALNEE